MNSLSSHTAYQPYFDKRKALSLGIAGAASGLGIFLVSAILRFLFDNYTFSGAMLLFGKYYIWFTNLYGNIVATSKLPLYKSSHCYKLYQGSLSQVQEQYY